MEQLGAEPAELKTLNNGKSAIINEIKDTDINKITNKKIEQDDTVALDDKNFGKF